MVISLISTKAYHHVSYGYYIYQCKHTTMQVVHGYFTYMTMKVIITYKPMTATNMKLNKFTNETKIQRCGQVSPSKL